MELSRRRLLAGVAGATATAGCLAPSSSGAGERDYTTTYREVSPSVVRIRVYGPNGPLGQGSGWVFRDGSVVTNQHVVADAERVRVQFNEGQWRVAEVLGTDVYADLAALSVPRRPDYAEPLSLVEAEPAIGTEVLVIGSPYGLGGSASQGIVSGQNRSLPTLNGFTVADAVQTDAALNPGNSGGPMVTLDGDVVGIATSAGGENIGFAISAALVDRVVPALVADGEFHHAYMGVRILGVTPLVAKANSLPAVRGVYVDGVPDDGPAAGVLRGSTGEKRVEGTAVPVGGDVVVGLGDREIDTTADLSTYLALETSPGDTIPVTLWRDGEETTVDLTLGRRPEPRA